jgi:hypothetical protein
MAARATVDLSRCLVKTFRVKAASSVTEGYAVKIEDGLIVLNCAAGDAANGIALESGAAGDLVAIALCNAGGLVPVKVGTGGATAGLYGVAVANGVANAGALGGGTTLVNIVCQFIENGVAGDVVGAIPLSIPAVT